MRRQRMGNGWLSAFLTVTVFFMNSTAFADTKVVVVPRSTPAKVSWQGGWSLYTDYKAGDVVNLDGKIYRCLTSHTASPADSPPDTAFWQVVPGQNEANTVNWAAVWSPGTDYKAADVVYRDDNVYQCRTDHTSSSANSPPDTTTWELIAGTEGEYSVGGAVWGLNSSSLVLQNNGGDNLVAAETWFEFPTPHASGSSYNVMVQSQPAGQDCAVSGGSGVLRGEDITDVKITCRSWRYSMRIDSLNSYESITPQIAMSSKGDGLAVWQHQGATRNIWASHYSAVSGWDTATLLGQGSGGTPQIAMDPDGNGLAVWNHNDGTRQNIWANHDSVGSGWSTATLIESDNTGHAQNPQIAMDSAGNGLAVWVQNDGTRDNIWTNRYSVGSGWATATLLEHDDAGDAYIPRIAMDPEGNGLAVWYQYDGTRYNSWASHYSVGSGWDTVTLLEQGTDDAFVESVAMDSNGNGVAVGIQSDGTRQNIWANHYSVGSGWATATLIESNDAGAASSPQIVLAPAGNGLAVWIQFDGTRYNIWANHYSPDSGWGSAIMIESDDASNAYGPQIAMDPAGNGLAVWFQSDGTRNNIWANRYSAGSGWATAALLEDDDRGEAYNPAIAMDPDGNGLTVWSQSDGSRSRIWARRYR